MINCGIDLGNTINSKNIPFPHIFPGAFEVIKKLVTKFNNTYIVSRVNSEQRERALKWFDDSDFFNQTGINKDNVYFCWERRDKAIFTKALNINVFIDDRPEVLIPMENVTKILFKPRNEDLIKFKDIIQQQNIIIINNWEQIDEYFLKVIIAQ